MAKQPDDLDLRVLKNIQQIRSEHSERLTRIEGSLEDVGDGVVAALGLATRADIRIDAIDNRLDALDARVDRMAKKR